MYRGRAGQSAKPACTPGGVAARGAAHAVAGNVARLHSVPHWCRLAAGAARSVSQQATGGDAAAVVGALAASKKSPPRTYIERRYQLSLPGRQMAAMPREDMPELAVAAGNLFVLWRQRQQTLLTAALQRPTTAWASCPSACGRSLCQSLWPDALSPDWEAVRMRFLPSPGDEAEIPWAQ